MTDQLPPELMDRVERLAAAEGISAEAYVLRCVEDAVGWAERTNAELDQPPASGGSENLDHMTDQQKRDYYMRQGKLGVLNLLATERAKPQQQPKDANRPPHVSQYAHILLEHVGLGNRRCLKAAASRARRL